MLLQSNKFDINSGKIVIEEKEMSIEVNVRVNGNEFIAFTDLFVDGVRSNIIYYLHDQRLLDLIEKYRSSLAELGRNRSINRSMSNAIKNLINIKSSLDLRSINILTEDSFNSVMARTTIELDADIVTVIHPSLLGKNALFLLHICNTTFVNYMLNSRLDLLMSDLRLVINSLPVRSILAILLSLPSIIPILTLDLNSINNLFILIIDAIGVPALVWRLIMPHILRYIIRHLISI